MVQLLNIFPTPNYSYFLDDWTSAVCAVVGTKKAGSDAVAMFKLMDKEMNNYVTWGHVLGTSEQ